MRLFKKLLSINVMLIKAFQIKLFKLIFAHRNPINKTWYMSFIHMHARIWGYPYVCIIYYKYRKYLVTTLQNYQELSAAN